MTVKLNFNPERLGRFWRERGIARLELFGSALNVVWDTIERDLPPLIVHLETYLAANPPPKS